MWKRQPNTVKQVSLLRAFKMSVYFEYLRVDDSFAENLRQLDSGKSQGKTKSPQPQAVLINVQFLYLKNSKCHLPWTPDF